MALITPLKYCLVWLSEGNQRRDKSLKSSSSTKLFSPSTTTQPTELMMFAGTSLQRRNLIIARMERSRLQRTWRNSITSRSKIWISQCWFQSWSHERVTLREATLRKGWLRWFLKFAFWQDSLRTNVPTLKSWRTWQTLLASPQPRESRDLINLLIKFWVSWVSYILIASLFDLIGVVCWLIVIFSQLNWYRQ